MGNVYLTDCVIFILYFTFLRIWFTCACYNSLLNTVNVVILVWRGHSIYFASSSVHADVNELKEKFNI